MKLFKDVVELLKRLYSERRLLHELFQDRDRIDISYEEALGFVESERNLRLLIEYGVVRLEDNLVELEDVYIQFFAEVLSMNEDITSSSVEENLQALKDNIDFYLKERGNKEGQDKYVRKILRSMRNIAAQASSKTVALKRVINDTYRQERNYDIKRQKLESNLTTIENIAYLIRSTEQLIKDRKDTLDNLAGNDRITQLTTEVRRQLSDIFHSLIELERTIRDYLHQIDAHNQLVKRIRKLKYLKDQLTWERSTNVRQVMEQCSHQLLETAPRYSTKVSLDFIRNTDEGLDAVSDACKAIRKVRSLSRNAPKPLSAEELSVGYVVEDYVDTDALANAFFASSQDLFTFIIQYPYSQPQSLDKRVEYYAEIVLNYASKLIITQDWRCLDSIEYPLIFNKP